jgi:hypothetical protein
MNFIIFFLIFVWLFSTFFINASKFSLMRCRTFTSGVSAHQIWTTLNIRVPILIERLHQIDTGFISTLFPIEILLREPVAVNRVAAGLVDTAASHHSTPYKI